MLQRHPRVPHWSAGVVAAWHVGGVATGPAVGDYRTVIAAAPLSDIVEVKFDEWMTPSVRPFPHDPAAARDGSAWYTAQLSNAVGRLDPTTGQFRNSRCPHPIPGRTVCSRCRWEYLVHEATLPASWQIRPKTGKVTE
jgi:virginiamycin B lyase